MMKFALVEQGIFSVVQVAGEGGGSGGGTAENEEKFVLVEVIGAGGAGGGSGTGLKRICEFAATKEECFPVAKGLEWVEVPDDTTTMDTILDGSVVKYEPPPMPPASILSQELMAQFTPADAVKIQAAIAANASLWLLWSSLQAQSDPMLVTSDRFKQGWTALTNVLGAARMNAIAAALGVTI